MLQQVKMRVHFYLAPGVLSAIKSVKQSQNEIKRLMLIRIQYGLLWQQANNGRKTVL